MRTANDMSNPDKWERRRIRNLVIKRAGRSKPDRILSRKQKEAEARNRVDYLVKELKAQNGGDKTT
jgi:hypothetical protein